MKLKEKAIIKIEEDFFVGNKLKVYKDINNGLQFYFSNPDLKNAIDLEMASEARQVFKIMQKQHFRYLFFSGEGDVFSAGGDLHYLRSLCDNQRKQNEIDMRQFYQSFLDIMQLNCPTIAYINGHAVGAGFCLALACDLRYAITMAKVGLNFTKLGLAPGMGAEYWLKSIPDVIAKEMILTSRIYMASELKNYNLFNLIDNKQEVETTIKETLQIIADNSRIANAHALKYLRQPTNNLTEVLDYQAKGQAHCLEQEALKDSIHAVKTKQSYQFKD